MYSKKDDQSAILMNTPTNTAKKRGRMGSPILRQMIVPIRDCRVYNLGFQHEWNRRADATKTNDIFTNFQQRVFDLFRSREV